MRQIRSRIREKRGVDYTEEEIRELASVKLEKFLDPRGVRSDLLDQFRRSKAAMPPPQNFAFEESTLFETHRGFIRWMRKLLQPHPEAVLQPEPAHPGAPHPVGAQHPQRQARGARRAALRGHPQPGARADPDRHRGEEPEDAGRVDVEPARLRRAAGARARGRGGLPRRRGGAAAAAGGSGSGRRRPRGRRQRPRAAHAAAPPPAAPAAPAGAATAGRGRPRARDGPRAVRAPRGGRPQPHRQGRRRPTPRPTREARDRRCSATAPTSTAAPSCTRATSRSGSRATPTSRSSPPARATTSPGATSCRRASRPSTGCTVRRFPVRHERVPREFGRLSERVFHHRHSIADELAWLDSEGPASPALIDHLARTPFDYALLFSYRYYHAWHAARRLHGRAVLVPTAERDPAITLGIFGPMFRGVRAVMYNSHEERAMIQAATGNDDGSRRRGRGRIGSARPHRPGAVPPQVQVHQAVRHLHRADRREQGLP